MNGLCAYLITRDHHLELPTPEPYLITHGDVGILVAETDVDRFALAEAELTPDSPVVSLIRQHDAVVRAVFATEPVLPLRFGTMFTDRRAAEQLLSEHHDALRERLAEVADHREWGVRVTARVSEPPIPPSTQNMSGTNYLLLRQRQLTAADQARREHAVAAATVHLGLAEHASDSTRRDRPGLLLDGAYLVRKTNEPAFHAALDRLATELDAQGITIERTGPWPPYSFTHLELAGAHA